FTAGHKPCRKIAERIWVNSPKCFAFQIVLVEFDDNTRIQRRKPVRDARDCNLWEDQTQRGYAAATRGLASPFEPQQRKRKTIFHFVRGVIAGYAEHGGVHRTAAQQSSSVVARERVLEVWRNAQKFQRFIRELLRKNAGKVATEFLAGKIPGGALETSS